MSKLFKNNLLTIILSILINITYKIKKHKSKELFGGAQAHDHQGLKWEKRIWIMKSTLK